MLVELAIQNFAIIEAVRIGFGAGLNVLTGETGAGKSILIDALGAVLGDRVHSDMVRTGTRAATIDATFDLDQCSNRGSVLSLLAELGIAEPGSDLILGREIQSGGRSGARLNGRPTTATILSQVGSLLVDIHGQSDHLSLLSTSAQRELLDRFARVTETRDQYGQGFAALRATRASLEQTVTGARERIQRTDLLRYQVDEIANANLRSGEEPELEAERMRLANADRLARDAGAAYAALVGVDEIAANGAALPSLRSAAQTLNDLTAIDPKSTTVAARAAEVLYLVEDIASDIRDYRDAIEADPDRLEIVEERLAEIRQLKRKYGADIAAILDCAREAEEELARLEGAESNAETLAAREAELAQESGALAEELSAMRSAAAAALAAEVENMVAKLNMGNARFAVAMERVEDPRGLPVGGTREIIKSFAADTFGIDRITFMIAPNSGEDLKPLSRIASGGETARLMLALKSILSEVDQTPTLVFDEIDVGVGGRSGQVVGETLWSLTNDHQVIVITHLPQIAAFADTHFRIEKGDREGRAISKFTELESSARVGELAAMLDGLPVSDTARQNAEEMIDRASEAKNVRIRHQ